MLNTLSPNARGALFMTICMAGFSLNDALVKLLAAQLSLYQIIFLRGLFATAFIGAMFWQSNEKLARPGQADLRMMALRLIGEVGGTLCFLTAISHMPLANATAILQAIPLAVTLAAALFLGEQVGWRRYLAIAVGFIGMLLIVRPGAADYNSYSLWAVAACAFLVLRDLSTRQLSSALPTRFITVITAITITLTGGLLSLFSPWSALSTGNLGLIALAAGFVLVGYLFGVLAMRSGEVGAIAPFRYSILLWAIMLGIVLFDEWPDSLALAGSALLAASGIYALHREALLSRQRKAIPTTSTK